MQPPLEGFVSVAHAGWDIQARPGWVTAVAAVIAATTESSGWTHRSKHARTRTLAAPGAPPAFLKVYHRYRWSATIKGVVRPAKAEHAAAASARLARAGFDAARVVLLGVRRRVGVVVGAFVVTEDVGAPDAIAFFTALGVTSALATKRHALTALGRFVGQLHEAGFCHGDLVPSNLRVRGEATCPHFVLIDNDRTRVRARPMSARLSRRNLVQLNRFPVPGVTATDRWRVLRAYGAARGFGAPGLRRLARLVIRKTIERRRRFDGIDAADALGFRMLMRCEAGNRVRVGGAIAPGADAVPSATAADRRET